MTYLCTETLFMENEEKSSFTKHYHYEAWKEEPGCITFVDDQGKLHDVDGQEEHGNWIQYFIKPEEDEQINKALTEIEQESLVNQ